MKYQGNDNFKGTITVFLSLILMMVLSLIAAVIESAAYSAARMKTEMAMDMGLDSLLAEYSRELLDRYDLYFIDTSYGSGSPSVSDTGEHLRTYMEYNLDPARGRLIFGSVDFTGLKLDEVNITDVSYASDNVGRVFKRQAIQAVKNMYGAALIEGVVRKTENSYSSYKQSGIEEEKPDERQLEIERKLDGIDYRVPECPATPVFDEKPGILDMIMSDAAVSDRHIDVSQLASHRTLNKGSGMRKPKEDPDSFANEILFGEYLVEKCLMYGRDTLNEKQGPAAYEIEYILNGENTDTANLRKTVEKLLLVRYAADTMFIFNDGKRREEVQTVLEVIGAFLGIPKEAADAAADLVLLAWAFGESVSDVKRLMADERVPLIKTDADWKMPLAGLFMLRASAHATGEKGQGLSYKDYMRIFLMLENKNEKVMRAMDVIELNLRFAGKGNEYFRIDGCAEYIDASAIVMARGRYKLSIKRNISYQTEF